MFVLQQELSKKKLIHRIFVTMTSVSLFYCCKNVFIQPYEYMDDWKKLNETLLLEKEMMQITRMKEEFCKHFTIKNLGEQHDLYVQSDTLLLKYMS